MAHRCRSLSIVLLLVLVTASFVTQGIAATRADRVTPGTFPSERPRYNVLLWYDPIDEYSQEWTHGDYTADASIEFHVDAYKAHPSGELSYWCGRLDPAFSGGDGYGNSWDQRLLLPPIELGMTVVEHRSWGSIKSLYRENAAGGDEAERGSAMEREQDRGTVPVLIFSYRHDCEAGFDFVRLQAQVNGVWVNVLDGFSGTSSGWQESGEVPVGDFGDPLHLRFRFLSDGACSDEDGVYDSDGGAFHVDNIRVYDYITGEELFVDDAEGGTAQCTPSIPEPAGDWWHIHEDYCSSAAYGYGLDPLCWWCGDESDSTLIPSGLRNWLQTPYIDRETTYGYARWCTFRFAIHPEVPVGQGDYWTEEITWNSGATWYLSGTWWDDFGECGGLAAYGLAGLGFYADGFGHAAMRWTFYTDDDGCGPGAAGSAGISLDHTWLEADQYGLRRPSSWEVIREIAR
ncbi:immune inhibitor A [bacterium]|nr:immune inhibitor A [bacterium]